MIVQFVNGTYELECGSTTNTGARGNDVSFAVSHFYAGTHLLAKPESFEVVAPSSQEMAARIERVSRTHPFLVADEDGVVVGYAYATHHRERSAYRWARSGWTPAV